MKVNITGDFFINTQISEPFELVKKVVPFFENADFNIVNLESPVTSEIKKNKILKSGPHLNGHPETFNILKLMNVKLVTLANNHILDYGKKGVEDTLTSLKQHNIASVGAGLNLHEAAQTFTLEKEGFKIAIVNFTENEWSIAENDLPGANPMDIVSNVSQIKEARQNHDKVVVIIHGGHEYYNLPSPRMVKQYRFYADNGADIIISHHTHCISGFEIYNNIPIFYSLGNFLFTLQSKHQCWFTGLVLQLELLKDKDITFHLLPVGQNKDNYKVDILRGEEKTAIELEIKNDNEIISNTKLLNHSWNIFIKENSKQYLQSISPVNIFGNRYIRAGVKRLNLDKLFMRKQYSKELLNTMRCEAHADAAKAVLKKYLSNK